MVDTLGLVLGVTVHSAGLQDRDGAKLLLRKVRDGKDGLTRLMRIFADAAYRGLLEDWVFLHCQWFLTIVSRNEPKHEFLVEPMRWVVERTLGWLNLSRRLSKDYEALPATSEAFLYVVSSSLMVRRLARNGQACRWQRKQR